MQLEWDDAKRAHLLEDRGIDILYAALIFEDPVLTKVDDRSDYGETRMISLGLVEDVPFVVVHTQRGPITRIITAWKGGRRDYDVYKKRFS